MTEITAEDARKILNAANKERFRKCQLAIEAILEQYHCQLVCQLSIVDGRIVGNPTLTERQDAP